MNISRKIGLTVFTSAAVLAMSAATALAQAAPEGPVEILVGANPGGGYDRMARSMETIIVDKKLLDMPLSISYHPGGGGAVAWATLNRTPGDMTKLSIFSPNIVTGDVLGSMDATYEDFTILSTLVFEDGCFAVNPNGNISSAEELVAALKDDPGSVRFSFAVSAGNQWHVAMAQLTDALGSDITKVRSTVFDSGSSAVSALLGEHSDVSVSGCASFAQYHESGDLKVAAVASPERMGGVLADVPTWNELGHDVVWGAWRGVLAPKDLNDEAIAYWENFFEAIVTDDAWKPIAEENYWRTAFKGSDESNEMLAKERDVYQRALRTLGLID